MSKKVTKSGHTDRKRMRLYCLLALGTIVAAITIWQIFLYLHAQSRVDFTVYKPTKLPSGYSTRDASIDIWSNRLWLGVGVGIDSPLPYSVEFTQTLNKQGSSINQSKNKDFEYNCPTNQELSACRIQSTEDGQKYKLTIDTYSSPSTIAEEYASFVKGSTLVVIRIHTNTDNLISSEEWSGTIDSFVPTSLAGVGAHYYHPGP